MVTSIRDDDELQLNAYCDGELDPASAIEFERRMAGDEFLKARYDRLLSVRRAVRSLPQLELPPGLRARINSKLDAEDHGQGRVVRLGQTGRVRQRSWSFQALAAAAVALNDGMSLAGIHLPKNCVEVNPANSQSMGTETHYFSSAISRN